MVYYLIFFDGIYLVGGNMLKWFLMQK